MQARLLAPIAAFLVAWAAAGGALAQTASPGAPQAAAAPAPVHIRGTIAKATRHELVVNQRGGGSADITLADPLTVSTLKRVPLSAIGNDAYVGIASRKGPNGVAQALEVLVFPPAMRGAGEGHYAWDLQPDSMMTNAPVTGIAKLKSGRDLTLTYKGGSFTVHVPPKTPIVTFAPASQADLKRGRKVFLIARKDAAGHLSTARVTVGTHGVNPPM